MSEGRLAKIRIISGLILMAYLVGHLINHSLGLISLQLMDDAGEVIRSIVRFPPISVLLYGALFLEKRTSR